MWIWYLSASDGGSVAAIAAQAHAAGVSTVFVKSSDGSTNYWSQFSPQLVRSPARPGPERVRVAVRLRHATRSARRNSGRGRSPNGADCLVIDAEAEYEGQLRARRRPTSTTLRARVGPAYPVGLASFPYVDYHPSFPYSVFLGPGGAQFNAPQMYWHDIGTSVDAVYANTYIRTASTAGRSCRSARPTAASAPRNSCASAAGGRRLRRGRVLVVGLAGNELGGWSGAR